MFFLQKMARRIAMLEADLERAEERASKNERFVVFFEGKKMPN